MTVFAERAVTDVSPPREGMCHVWLAQPPEANEVEATAFAVLSPDEADRMARFHFERDRLLYGTAHVLLRQALSCHAPEVAPSVWRFAAGPYGRPEIGWPERLRSLRFNLSHTRGLAACVVARDIACGIDVEARRHARSPELAAYVLTRSEQARIAAAPPEERDDCFSRFWTLKEAYAKARGLGLSMPFDTVGFRLEADGAALCESPDAEVTADAWQFVQWYPGADHVAAVALERGSGPAWRIEIHPAGSW